MGNENSLTKQGGEENSCPVIYSFIQVNQHLTMKGMQRWLRQGHCPTEVHMIIRGRQRRYMEGARVTSSICGSQRNLQRAVTFDLLKNEEACAKHIHVQ